MVVRSSLFGNWRQHLQQLVVGWVLVVGFTLGSFRSFSQDSTTILATANQWATSPSIMHIDAMLQNARPYYAIDSLTEKMDDPKLNLFKPLSIKEKLPSYFIPYSSFTNPLFDSTPALSKKTIQQRVRIVAAANIVVYGGTMVGLYHAWYKNYPQSSFHFYNDIKEWKGMDKIGHVYSAYAESKASMELWRWTGISRNKRIWIGGMSGAVYQTAIEVLDGFSEEWGWSWGDFAANIAGSGLLVAQELAWDEQRIQMKWSFNRKRYDDPQLNKRSDELFGKGLAERMLKDYNGQTYWLSTSLKPFFKNSKIPAWLQISVGTGVEGLFGGYENIGKDDQGVLTFNRTDIPRRRQWYLAPDVDLTKIKTNKKGIKVALQILNIIKFPTPSLAYSAGGFKWNWLHF